MLCIKYVYLFKIKTMNQGTTDQYQMGDLSGKFGTLDRHKQYMGHYNDSLMPLFGPRSILGRSIVIHKKVSKYKIIQMQYILISKS